MNKRKLRKKQIMISHPDIDVTFTRRKGRSFEVKTMKLFKFFEKFAWIGLWGDEIFKN